MEKKLAKTTGDGEVVKTVIYHSPYMRQSFMLPVRDNLGNLIQARDPQGNLRFAKGTGRPIYQERQIIFGCNSANPALGYDSSITVTYVRGPNGEPEPLDPALSEALEKLADDPATKIVREDEWKAKRNPQAFAMEQKLKDEQAISATLRTQLEEQGSALSQMQAELAKVKAEHSKGK